MKKILFFIIIFVLTFSLIACKDDYTDHKKILSLVNNFSVTKTNGFDYSVEQKINSTIVNSHSIIIRLDSSSEIIGSRVEYKKSLNSTISNNQFIEQNATSYYKDNNVLTKINDIWEWKNCTLNEFAEVKINYFNFDIDSLQEIKLIKNNICNIFSFKIDDSNSSTFLGCSGDVKNLKFEIETDASFDKLISFNMSYSQELTETYFILNPYYGSVNITIPEI